MSSTASPRDSRPAARLLPDLTARLAAAGLTSPAAEARALLTHVVAGELLLAPPLTGEQVERLERLVARRLAGDPLQHVLGEMAFCHLTLASDSRALIARPETELLAEAAVRELARMQAAGDRPFLVADLGTGSGALALAIATRIPRTRVLACDIDSDALALAAVNTERYATELAAADSRVELIHADFTTWQAPAPLDLLVANPPYLPDGELPPADVTKDPRRALFGGGEDGMELPRATLGAAARLLAPGALAIIEHHDSQGEAMRRTAHAAGLTNIQTHRDLAGRERYLTVRCTVGAERGKIEP
ncbi:N5-glutamine methyltransferase family protein [Bowdeniella massiliensis]|uniref:N5-glutamine methyltransferase family protein n=1 Tax=Bowdeniella massiliensis TaxID=2932264 RepID=UPI0020278F81|nr:HemK/PrmC family methyltransferase [Bowdeniella massiliensis]